MKMIRLAIFDLDGTLVDSICDLADSVNKALADGGYPTHPYESYRRFVGNGAKKLIERAMPKGAPDSECERIHAAFSENYKERCLNKTRPYDGIIELLDRLREGGIKCAVASNKPDSFSKHIVTELFGGGRFDLVLGKRDGVGVKPSPDIVNDIMSALGCTAEQSVMIGDSDVDVLTAHNAGLPCIGCTWGFRGKAELENAGADMTADSPDDIDKLINTLL